MYQIFYSDNMTPQKELDAEFFTNFNWQNFNPGDIVWLEDNEETYQPAANFLGLQDDRVVLYGVNYEIARRFSK